MSRLEEYLEGEKFSEALAEQYVEKLRKFHDDYDAKLKIIWGWIKQNKITFKEFKYIMEKAM